MVGTSPETMGGISTVVTAYMNAGLFQRCNIEYISTHCDGSGFKKLKTAFLGFVKFLGKLCFNKIKIVHIHVSSRASFWRKSLFIVIANLFGKKIIFHLHGSEFREFFDDELSDSRRSLATKIIDMASVVIVLSESWKAWMSTHIDVNKVTVLENSINSIQLPTSDAASENQLLFLGRIGKRKGFWDLLSALQKIKEKGIEFTLIAGGDGETEKAKALVEELDLGQHVKFVGWINGKEKLGLLASSSVFVLPSYNEGMPMSVLEALASGLPIISTTIGGIPHQVTNEVEGFLLTPGDVKGLEDRLETLLTSPQLRSDFSKKALEKFDTCFSTNVVLPKLERIYDELDREN